MNAPSKGPLPKVGNRISVIPICLPIGGSRRHSARSKRFVSGIEITFVEVESLLKVGIPFNKSVEVVGNEH